MIQLASLITRLIFAKRSILHLILFLETSKSKCYRPNSLALRYVKNIVNIKIYDYIYIANRYIQHIKTATLILFNECNATQ